MAGPPAPAQAQLEYWSELFRGGGGGAAKSDIFKVIENAILVAAWDRSQELRIRRDRIVERLYTALLLRCFGCDWAELRSASAVVASSATAAAASGGGGGDKAEEGGGSVRREPEKGSKVGSSNDGSEDLRRVVSSSNYSYDEAEALTEEIEEESQIVGEVLRIKETLINKQDQLSNIMREDRCFGSCYKRCAGFESNQLFSVFSDELNPPLKHQATLEPTYIVSLWGKRPLKSSRAMHAAIRFTAYNGAAVNLIASPKGAVVQAAYSDVGKPSNASIFVGGFVLGGIVAGLLGCAYAPQVALVVFLSHIGSFVPADSAIVGMTDRIFCAMGSKPMTSEQSTFMIDLHQVGMMLRHATSRSLCLLDEFGKGTLTGSPVR